MATATTKTKAPTERARLEGELATRRERLAAVLQQRRSLETKSALLWGALGPTRLIDGHQPTYPAHELMQMQLDLTALRAEWPAVEAQRARLQADIETLETERRRVLRREYSERKAGPLQQLHDLLVDAAEVNAKLRDIELEEAQACGATTRWSWPELDSEQPAYTSRLTTWSRACCAKGFEM